MRHLIGLLSVVTQLLDGLHSHYTMFAIINLGFTFKKAEIGSLKEKEPLSEGDQTIISIAV